jgi:hypothetical protein
MLMEIMLEGIIRWLTETPYPNLRQGMPPQYQELHKQQLAGTRCFTGDGQNTGELHLQQQHLLQPQKQ